jgi:hypothetical protein
MNTIKTLLSYKLESLKLVFNIYLLPTIKTLSVLYILIACVIALVSLF